MSENILDLRSFRESPAFVVSAPRCFHARYSKVPSREECSFRVRWKINAHMQPGAVSPSKAIAQHDNFRRVLHEQGSTLIPLPFVHGSYDSVFVKDMAVLGSRGNRFVALLAKPSCDERKREQEARANDLTNEGFEIVDVSAENLEGGDVVTNSGLAEAFLGFGFRSDEAAAGRLSTFLGKPVVPLELTDPYFYHLDTALAILRDGTALAYKDAFTPSAWNRLADSKSIRSLITVSRSDAMNFGLNLVEVGNTVILGGEAPGVSRALKAMGKEIRLAHLSEFQLAGGSAACLTAPIHQLN